MQVTETRSEGLTKEFKIVVTASDLDARLSEHLETLKGQIQLKGFRPGKVPVSYLRKAYGKSAMGEVIQKTVEEASSKAIEEHALKPAQAPKIDLDGEIEEVVEGKADLAITMAVELMPEFEPADVSKLKLERPVADVTDEETNKALDDLADQQKSFKPRGKTAKAKDGDQLSIDFIGSVDGEEFEGGKGESLPLVLGSGSFIPGFEEQLTGAKTDDKVTVNVTFPEDYSAKNLAGKAAEFAVTVREVAAPEKAAVNDELATKLGLESLEKLRELVEGRIKEDFTRASRDKLKRHLLDALDELHSFELPPGLVTTEFDQVWGQVTADLEKSGTSFEDEGETEESARADYLKIAERRVRLGLVLAEIGQQNKIDVTEQEITRALSEQARQYPGQEQQVYEFYTKNAQALAQIRAPLFEDKVIDFIVELADVTEKKVSRDELFADPEEKAGKDKKVKAKSKPKSKKKAVQKKKPAAASKSKKSESDENESD